MLPFQTLDVYRSALELARLADLVADELPPEAGALRATLRAEALAIPVQIATASSADTADEASACYAAARRTVYRCAALFDVVRAIDAADAETLACGRDLLRDLAGALAPAAPRDLDA